MTDLATGTPRRVTTTSTVPEPQTWRPLPPVRAGCPQLTDADLQAISGAVTENKQAEISTQGRRCRCADTPPCIHCRQWVYRATASHLAPTAPAPTPLPEEHEVIKVSRLMVLTSRISISIEILGRSKDGHTRPWHWQANMDVRWKFYRRPRSGNFGQNRLGRVAVGDPDPTANRHGTTHGSPTCGFEWTDESSRTLILLWSCTQKLGHQGQHLAGTGEWVAAVHPQ